jgi:hypothetical protein
METVGDWWQRVSALASVLQRAPSDPENLRQLDVVFSAQTGLNDGDRQAPEHDAFRSGEMAPALNPLSEVGNVTIEPFAGNAWG